MNFSMMGNRQAIDNSDDGAPFFVLHVDEEEKKREGRTCSWLLA